jgi:hypothetical protein
MVKPERIKQPVPVTYSDGLQDVSRSGRLANQVAAQEARIRELEAGRSPRAPEPAANVPPAPTPATAPNPAGMADGSMEILAAKGPVYTG